MVLDASLLNSYTIIGTYKKHNLAYIYHKAEVWGTQWNSNSLHSKNGKVHKPLFYQKARLKKRKRNLRFDTKLYEATSEDQTHNLVVIIYTTKLVWFVCLMAYQPLQVI